MDQSHAMIRRITGGRCDAHWDVAANRAVFLDRDGVINANLERNGRPVAPTTLQEFRILPGVEDAVRQLKAAGFHIIVVTNQPDVPAGLTPHATVLAMHERIRQRMPIDDIRICFHLDSDNCDCRKPKPGLLLAAAADHALDLGSSYIVGDRWRDIQAGRAAGCFTIFVDYGYRQDGAMHPDKIVCSLAEAAVFIGKRESQAFIRD